MRNQNTNKAAKETSSAKTDIIKTLISEKYQFKVEKPEVKYLNFQEEGDFVQGIYGGVQRIWNKKIKDSSGKEIGGFEYRNVVFSQDFSVMQILPYSYDISDKLRGIFTDTLILIVCEKIEFNKAGYKTFITGVYIPS